MSSKLKVLSIMMVIFLVLSSSSSVFAAEALQLGVVWEKFVFNGETYNYYYGSDGNTYTIHNGEVMPIIIPKHAKAVKDPEILAMLNAKYKTSLRTSPVTNYVDISADGPNIYQSVRYSAYADLSSGSFTTDILKINSSKNIIRLRTTDIKKNSIFASKKITFTLYYYDPIEHEWDQYDANVGTVCTGSEGYGVEIIKGYYSFIYYVVRPVNNNIANCTVNVWTTLT